MASGIPEVLRPEHPFPQWVRTQWINLNGEWGFAVDPGDSGEERGLASCTDLPQRIRVPFAPQSRLSGVHVADFLRAVWYQRVVHVPAQWTGHSVLHVGAADYEATVWVDGVVQGRHVGGYTPFSVDLGHRAGRAVSIVIRVRDDERDPAIPSGKQSPRYASYHCMYSRTTGIWQTVWLEHVPAAHVALARTQWLPGTDTLVVRPEVAAEDFSGHLRVTASCGRQRLAQGSVEVSTRGTALALVLPRPPLWSPATPNLVDLQYELVAGDGSVVDRVASYVGLRWLEIRGPHLLLNGEPLYQRLVLDQGFYPDGIYTAPTDDALRQDVAWAKELGFNGVRLHQKVFEPRYLYWADRLGLLCWGEFPSWGFAGDGVGGPFAERSRAAQAAFIHQWLEVLQRDREHPSIITWCPLNETLKDRDSAFSNLLWKLTRELDPTRPVIDASGYYHGETDIFDVHDYTQDPDRMRAVYTRFQGKAVPQHDLELEVPYRGQPFIVSEYGGTWWSAETFGEQSWGYGDHPKTKDEVVRRMDGLTGALLDNPAIAGFCYTQLYDVEQEQNGLLTYDRQPKFDAGRMRSIFARPSAYEQVRGFSCSPSGTPAGGQEDAP